MDMKKLEPFAWGYIHAGRDDLGYRIANGMKTFSEVFDTDIIAEDWFQAPVGRFGSYAVHYSRSDGIVLKEDVRNKNADGLSELKELEELNFYYDYFRPYETTRIISKVRTPTEEKLEINKCAWAAGGGHSNPDYEMLLRIGTNGIRKKIGIFKKVHIDKKDFYDSLILTTEALETAADRYREKALSMISSADDGDKEILTRIADAFSNIPRNKPRNFFEACQFFWLSFSLFDIDSPGLFDYALGAYYTDSDEDYKCLERLWELFRKTRTWNLCVGRSDEFGNDYTNKLSYAVLRMAKEKKYNTPNITMRENKNTKKEKFVLSEDIETSNKQVAEYTKKFCEQHKALIDRLGE